MDICVVGLGYIGLPTALMLASKSEHHIIGVDCSERVVSSLQNGVVTFEEEGLGELFKQACEKGIEFTTEYVPADMYIVAVPTPYDKETKSVDASYVVEAVKDVLPASKEGTILAIESTVSPGTIDKRVRPLIEERGLEIGKDIHLVHTPERIIPGNMLKELVENSRTIGADEPEIGAQVKEVYASFCKGEIILTDIRTAEMSKVVENIYRDVNIAYANELAKICHAAGLDVYEVIDIANHHPRVNILQPGPGVGGHCIPVDSWFIVADYPFIADLIHQARTTNLSMPEYVLDRLSEIMKKHGIEDESRVGFYGLTYKENVDDIRDSPTLQLAECLEKHLGSHRAKFYDPYVDHEIVDGQMYDLNEFLDSVDVVVVMVAHDEIVNNVDLLKDKVVFDTRHCIDLEGVERL